MRGRATEHAHYRAHFCRNFNALNPPPPLRTRLPSGRPYASSVPSLREGAEALRVSGGGGLESGTAAGPTTVGGAAGAHRPRGVQATPQSGSARRGSVSALTTSPADRAARSPVGWRVKGCGGYASVPGPVSQARPARRGQGLRRQERHHRAGVTAGRSRAVVSPGRGASAFVETVFSIHLRAMARRSASALPSPPETRTAKTPARNLATTATVSLSAFRRAHVRRRRRSDLRAARGGAGLL